MRSEFSLRFNRASAASPADARSSRMSRALGAVMLPLILAACQTTPDPAVKAAATVEVVQEPGWRTSASASDVARIDRVQAAWNEALANARTRGFARQMSAEGKLLEPSAALPRPAPTPGNYMCRWIRFGTGESRSRAFTTYQPFFCHVGASDDSLSLTKQTGSDRPSGYLFEDLNPRRMVFLGSMALGSESEPLAYGEDVARDMAGVFERIGPMRFRLVIPRPRSGWILEVLELTPAPVQSDE